MNERDWTREKHLSSPAFSVTTRPLLIMAPRMFEVSFKENYAILRMKSGENRLNVEFLKEFHSSLDEIERYSPLVNFFLQCAKVSFPGSFHQVAPKLINRGNLGSATNTQALPGSYSNSRVRNTLYIYHSKLHFASPSCAGGIPTPQNFWWVCTAWISKPYFRGVCHWPF